MASDERPLFELSARLQNIRRCAALGVLATFIAQWVGFSHFDRGLGLTFQTALVVVVVAITAYDFVKLGRRRTPSRW